jgi:hypothetical protein
VGSHPAISLKINLFSPYFRKIAELALNNNQSLIVMITFFQAGIHVAPLRHTNMIASQPVFALSP